MGAFGRLSLPAGLGILLGSLVALAFMAGCIKLCINRRRIANRIKFDMLKTKERIAAKEISTEKLGEGNLFGARALEGGYHGGTLRSRSSSPSFILSSQRTITGSSRPGTKTTTSAFSASSSSTDLPSAGLGFSVGRKGHKPSPLQLQSNEDGNSSKSLSPRAYNASGFVGIYMLPGGNKPLNGLPLGTQAKEWVSPLDEHFSRVQPPSPPPVQVMARPHSYLPRLDLPEAFAAGGKGQQPEVGSLNGSEVSQLTTKFTGKIIEVQYPSTGENSPAGSSYHNFIPSRASRDASRSMFPYDGSRRDRRTSQPRRSQERMRPNIPVADIQSVPQAAVVTIANPDEDDEEFESRLVIQDSTSKPQCALISNPSPQSSSTTPKPAQIIIPTTISQNAWTGQEKSIAGVHISERDRSRSTSTSSRSSMSTTLSRTRDSIRRPSASHFRKSSTHSRERSTHRYIRDRDRMHYDPTHQHRSRSGSVQGRAVDFDHPRESPFSSANALSSLHSRVSSLASFKSTVHHQNPMPSKRLPSPARGRGLKAPAK